MTIRNSEPNNGHLEAVSNRMDYFQSIPAPSIGSLTISEHEVHVWRVALEVSNSVERHLRQLLSADEHARLVRFKSLNDRRRFAIRRGTLRIVLGAYVGVPGAELRFTHGKNGKPEIENSRDCVVPCFSASSSANLALIAVSGQLPLGIDVEFMRPIDDIHDIAARFFSRHEHDSLADLPRDLRLSGFYRIWTSKEAIVKADGTGLSMPLDSFAVRSDPRYPPQLLHTTQDINAPKDLILYELYPGKDFSGALATSRSDLVIRGWSIDLSQMA